MAAAVHPPFFDRLLTSIDRLKDKDQHPSDMELLFLLANETIGIAVENYLPWQERFLGKEGAISEISANDLGQNALAWGITPDARPFLAFQYHIDIFDLQQNQAHLRRGVRECTVLFLTSFATKTVKQAGQHSFLILIEDASNSRQVFKQLRQLWSGEIVTTVMLLDSVTSTISIPFVDETVSSPLSQQKKETTPPEPQTITANCQLL